MAARHALLWEKIANVPVYYDPVQHAMCSKLNWSDPHLGCRMHFLSNVEPEKQAVDPCILNDSVRERRGRRNPYACLPLQKHA